MGANPRLATSTGMTGAGVAAAEGSANSCTDGCVGDRSGGKSIGATTSADSRGGSSNRTDGCGGGDGGTLADLMPAMTSIL
jgi:hypothetical protein